MKWGNIFNLFKKRGPRNTPGNILANLPPATSLTFLPNFSPTSMSAPSNYSAMSFSEMMEQEWNMVERRNSLPNNRPLNDTSSNDYNENLRERVIAEAGGTGNIQRLIERDVGRARERREEVERELAMSRARAEELARMSRVTSSGAVNIRPGDWGQTYVSNQLSTTPDTTSFPIISSGTVADLVGIGSVNSPLHVTSQIGNIGSKITFYLENVVRENVTLKERVSQMEIEIASLRERIRGERNGIKDLEIE